jgi:hypothetical protein
MEESQGMNHHGHEGEPATAGINRWMVLAAVALLAIAVAAFGYGYRQQVMVGHLTAQESVAKATINDMQGQLTLRQGQNRMAARAAPRRANNSKSFAHSSTSNKSS